MKEEATVIENQSSEPENAAKRGGEKKSQKLTGTPSRNEVSLRGSARLAVKERVDYMAEKIDYSMT